MRIGIFGGSFDPVHLEHYNLVEAAIKSLSLDKLIVMPAHTPPHKQGKTLTSNAQRFEMCKLAFSDLEKVEVSDYELEKGGVSYTYQTCEYFKNVYQDATLFWLVGTDMLRDFPSWRKPEEILKMATLAVCARAEDPNWLEREKKSFFEKFQTDFVVINYHGKDVSSTKVRVLAAAGEDISSIVGEKLSNYILEKGLYEVKGAKEALALEKPSRKAHTLRVAEMAAARALSLGISERTAITAALFHDCAKNLDNNSPLLQGFSIVQGVPAPVLHQFTGAYVAEKHFGVEDEDILNAIRYHTSGRKEMSALERLIFLSDMLEEERTFEGVEELRKLFWDKSDDLTVCMAVALAHSLEYLKSKGGEIYALTEEAESYYQKFNRK
jgi:nicotinate-nucleotide adenylyltransferase